MLLPLSSFKLLFYCIGSYRLDSLLYISVNAHFHCPNHKFSPPPLIFLTLPLFKPVIIELAVGGNVYLRSHQTRFVFVDITAPCARPARCDFANLNVAYYLACEWYVPSASQRPL